MLNSVYQFKDNLVKISLTNAANAEDPQWINGWLPGLDSAAIYTITCLHKPKLYIEVGSGNSTKFARRAIKDHNLSTKIISIDPQPRAEINSICDKIIRQPLEDVDLKFFKELESGDFLYIDGSHCCFQNSDVTVVFLDILPKLKPGVIVEFHDIFLPYDYPHAWKERYYSEQYMLAACLLSNPDKYKILLPNAFITEDPELSHILDSLWDEPELRGTEKHGGSFWIQIN